MKPFVAIVGRPNVGKSTLFNRLVGRQAAVVDDLPGVTRDRLFADVLLKGRPAVLIDTGGFEPNTKDELAKSAVQQARLAVEEADLVLFLCDARDGLHPLDREVATLLRKSQKPVLVALNKADPGAASREPWEFSCLGFELMSVSALHGSGLDLLVENLVALLPPVAPEEPLAGPAVDFRLCLLGRPNVGKSSLANRLAGQERQIVSAIPGTTRDAVDILLERQEMRCVLVDTPGVRRKARISERLEHYSVVAALRSLERVQVAVVVLDAGEPFSDQDARLLALVQERGRGLVVAVNKSDLWRGQERADYLRALRHGMRFVAWAPMTIVSARTGDGIAKILQAAREVAHWCGHRLATSDLNQFIEQAVERLEPPMIRGKRARIYYLTQTGAYPPTLVGSVNDPARIPASYQRYLERRLRQRWRFPGTPLRWIFRPHSEGRPKRPHKRRNSRR